MGLKTRIEENPVVWLITTLAVGFAAGFGAYETILRVSDQTRISHSRKIDLEEKAARVDEIQQQLERFQARKGEPPSDSQLILTGGLLGDHPAESIEEVPLGSSVIFYVKWFGLTPNAVYQVRWQLRDDSGGIVSESTSLFVSEISTYNTWWRQSLASPDYSAGTYRLRVEIDDTEYIDEKVIVLEQRRAQDG